MRVIIAAMKGPGVHFQSMKYLQGINIHNVPPPNNIIIGNCLCLVFIATILFIFILIYCLNCCVKL